MKNSHISSLQPYTAYTHAYASSHDLGEPGGRLAAHSFDNNHTLLPQSLDGPISTRTVGHQTKSSNESKAIPQRLASSFLFYIAPSLLLLLMRAQKMPSHLGTLTRQQKTRQNMSHGLRTLSLPPHPWTDSTLGIFPLRHIIHNSFVSGVRHIRASLRPSTESLLPLGRYWRPSRPRRRHCLCFQGRGVAAVWKTTLSLRRLEKTTYPIEIYTHKSGLPSLDLFPSFSFLLRSASRRTHSRGRQQAPRRRHRRRRRRGPGRRPSCCRR